MGSVPEFFLAPIGLAVERSTFGVEQLSKLQIRSRMDVQQ
jgi:hypothetical protein